MHIPHRIAGRPAFGIRAAKKGAISTTYARDPATQVRGSLSTPRHRAPREAARWRGGYLPRVDDFLSSEGGGYLPRVDGYLPSERDGLPGPPPLRHADGMPRKLPRLISLFSVTCQKAHQTQPANLAALRGVNSAARQILPRWRGRGDRRCAGTARRQAFGSRTTEIVSLPHSGLARLPLLRTRPFLFRTPGVTSPRLQQHRPLQRNS